MMTLMKTAVLMEEIGSYDRATTTEEHILAAIEPVLTEKVEAALGGRQVDLTGGEIARISLAEHSGCRAVVINPAVFPARDLARYIGEQTSWHDPQDRFFFRPEFIAELDDLHPAALTRPERYFALIATGDEVLDWREMRDRYAACPMQIIEGSDHALSDFETWLPQVMRFIGG